MRTGVNTGDVVASREPRAEVGMVTGDAVNAAARLEQTADAGQILVSERTARSARGFRFSDVGPLAVRGKSRPVATVELLDEGLDELPGGRERGVPGLRAPMVGRDHELELLRSTYGRLASSGRAQLVTIYGDPGIGKSRLTRELLAWADAQGDGVTVLKGRCLPYGEAITYWPLAEILKSYTGVLDSDPPDVALAKIAALADDVLAGVPDPARSAGVLAFTFGLEDPRFGLATLPPRQVRLETHEAWRAFFTGLTADRPAIVVVEDIHWADDPLLDLLEELADRVAGPLLFVCPARPDLAQRRTGVGRRQAQLQLDLPRAPLARRRRDARRGPPRRRGAARTRRGRRCSRVPTGTRSSSRRSSGSSSTKGGSSATAAGGARPRASTRS